MTNKQEKETDLPIDNIINLSDALEDTTCEVVKVEGGRGCQAKLIAVGIRRGAKVQVLHNSGKGPVAVAIGLMRLALGRGMAFRVKVKPL